jgi:hypothetical protein
MGAALSVVEREAKVLMEHRPTRQVRPLFPTRCSLAVEEAGAVDVLLLVVGVMVEMVLLQAVAAVVAAMEWARPAPTKAEMAGPGQRAVFSS